MAIEMTKLIPISSYCHQIVNLACPMLDINLSQAPQHPVLCVSHPICHNYFHRAPFSWALEHTFVFFFLLRTLGILDHTASTGSTWQVGFFSLALGCFVVIIVVVVMFSILFSNRLRTEFSL